MALTPVQQKEVERALNYSLSQERWLLVAWHLKGAELNFSMGADKFPNDAHGYAIEVLARELEKFRQGTTTRQSGLLVAGPGAKPVNAMHGCNVPVEADTPPFDLADRFADAARRLGMLVEIGGGRLEKTYTIRKPL